MAINLGIRETVRKESAGTHAGVSLTRHREGFRWHCPGSDSLNGGIHVP